MSNCEIVPIVLAILGWWISYFASLKIFMISKNAEKESDRIEAKRVQINFLKGIKAELMAIHHRFDQSLFYREELISQHGYFNCHYRVEQRYFTFYESSCHVIGEIKDENLICDIVNLYTMLNSAIETFNINNDMLVKYEEYIVKSAVNKDCIISANLKTIYLNDLHQFTSNIESAFKVVEVDLINTVSKIDSYITN